MLICSVYIVHSASTLIIELATNMVVYYVYSNFGVLQLLHVACIADVATAEEEH